jgi:hypothetical protein
MTAEQHILVEGISPPVLYTRKFYGVSIAANMISLAGGLFLFHDYSVVILIAALEAVLAVLGIEFLVKSHMGYRAPGVGRAPEKADRAAIDERYALKSIVGMLAISMTVIEIDHPAVLFLAPLMFLVYTSFNTILCSRAVRYANVTMLLFSICISLSRGSTHSFLLLYAFISAMTVLVVLLCRMLLQASISVHREREQSAHTLLTVTRMSSWVKRHDLNNVLAGLQGMSTPKYRLDPILFADTMQSYFDKFKAILDEGDALDHRAAVDLLLVTKYAVTQVGRKVVVESPVSQGDNPISCSVTTYRPMLLPTIRGILENSFEAAMRKEMGDPVVRAIVLPDRIVIEDNCGGYNPRGITPGRTSKVGKGHGYFLSTMTSPTIQKVFGFRVVAERIPGGSRHTIVFTNV